MRSHGFAFACLICIGHARMVPTELEGRDWELKNLARYHAGELSEAELGIANFVDALKDPSVLLEAAKLMNDPEVLAEVMQSLNDPEFVKQLEEQWADPSFQEKARQAITQQVRAEHAQKVPTDSLATLLFAMNPTRSHSRGTSNVKMESNADLRLLAKKLNPVVGYWDPLNLGADTVGTRSEPLIGFLRHAEIKHGRVSMAAFVGYCITANGLRWPTAPFESITATSPLDQWDALPVATRWNLILGMALLEGWGEVSAPGKKHYMKGGEPGYYPDYKEFDKDTLTGWFPGASLWDPLGYTKNMAPEKRERRLVAELNNGRLAMLGISAFISEAKIPGAVPFLNGVVPPYKGDLVFPPGQYDWIVGFQYPGK